MAIRKFSKDDLILALNKKMKLSEDDLEILYQELINQLQENMARDNKIRIAGLGTFYSNADKNHKNFKPKLKLSKKIDKALNS